MALDWGKRFVLKGLAGGQVYFDELLKYIFTCLRIIIGNVPSVI